MGKKQRKPFIDDGHTIYDMSGIENIKPTNKKETIYVPKEEKKVLIKSAWSAYLPQLICIILGFGLTILLILLWLS